MTKTTIALLVAILLGSALLGSGTLTRGQAWGDDFAAYLMQAKSVLAGEMEAFVARNAFTVTHSSHQIGPAAYPWGFPLMLAPVYAAAGLSPLALKLPGLLTFLGFLLAFFLWMKRRFAAPESLLAVALFAFHPGLLLFLDNILSDIPFLFFSTLALLLADLHVRETRDRRRLALAAGTGVVIFAAAFVRTQGLILLASALLFLGIRFLRERAERRQIARDAVALLAAFGALWGLAALVFPGGQGSYLALYSGFGPDTMIGNMTGYSQVFGLFFESLPASMLVFGIFVFLFVIGLATRIKDELFPALYALLYLAVLWSWPEWQGFRFLFPMLPLFILFAWRGLESLLGVLPSTWAHAGRLIARGALALMAVAFLWNAGSNAAANLQEDRAINGPFDPYSIELYDFIKEETPPDSVIVFFKPRALRLMTGRDTFASTECERMTLGDYIALSKKVGENLQIPPEQIETCGLPLESIFQNRRFVVYQVLDRGE
ncbi:MAG: hypothetical protein ACOYYU_02805 [Chloroflexota bacterium]